MQDNRFGSKGEWWVVAQFIFVPLALVVAVLVRMDGALAPELRVISNALAAVFGMYAAAIVLWGVLHLGNNLTAVPHPKEDGFLVQTGAYAIVRHPIYSGVIFAVLAWMLFFFSWLGLGFAVIVFVFFDQKSRREERWLAEKYADYAAYQARVRKLIPLVY
jgi:protein-S-isoprenylcysteine O-methyltransferase Ste14